MKRVKVTLLCFILAAGLLVGVNCTSFDCKHRIFDDIESFKRARMRLPEKHDSVYREYRITRSQQCDLDGNGKPEEYVLKDGHLTVKEDSNIIWQSPEDWWVDYFFIGDSTNDGRPKLNLSVWKEGSFGPYKPFWIKDEDTSVKNHLFIFQLEKNKFKPVWQSSNLDCPMLHATLMDLNGDGEKELVVREGSYTDPKKCEVTIWKWDGWGFSKIEYK